MRAYSPIASGSRSTWCLFALAVYVTGSVLSTPYSAFEKATSGISGTMTGISYVSIGALCVQFGQAAAYLSRCFLPLAHLLYAACFPGAPAAIALDFAAVPDVLGTNTYILAWLTAGIASVAGAWNAT